MCLGICSIFSSAQTLDEASGVRGHAEAIERVCCPQGDGEEDAPAAVGAAAGGAQRGAAAADVAMSSLGAAMVAVA